ncbi:helix-turn-helix domain-containing protein [Saccharothrix sp. AJ9571]|nr:helix-turn-helix domain-containing protein [Saccharothrix sp. AJ9571]
MSLLLAEAGRTTITIRAGEQRRHHEWAPGRLLLNGPDRPVRVSYQATEELRGTLVRVPRETVERTAGKLEHPDVDYERMADLLPADDPFLRGMVRALDAASRSRAGEPYAEAAAGFLVAHLLTHYSMRSARTTRFPETENARIQAVITLMRDHLDEPLTLADLADEVYLSVYHLARVFKEATGETPRRYLTRLRLERAERLLRDSDLAIAEIAPLCGFASPSALSNAFLRKTGKRPSSYRTS